MAILVRVDRAKSFGARINVASSGRNLHCARGNEMVVRLAVYDEAGAILDLTDHASLNLAYMPASRTADAIASKTASITDATFTEAQFLAGTHYHAEFTFTETDMNPSLGSALSVEYWLVAFGIKTSGGGEVTHGGGTLIVEEDGTDNTVDAPDAPAVGITSAQASALIDAAIAAENFITNPMTTAGDLVIGGASGTPTRLAKGSDGQVLKVVSGALAWASDSTSSILNNFAATTDPGTGDDSGDGYSIGSQWLNTSTDKLFVCHDATLTAAVWERIDQDAGILNNFSATTDPGTGDDSGDGYSVGSRWINLTTDKTFTCTDASVGAAVWVWDNETDDVGMTNPMTTAGDLIVGGSSGTPGRLAKGTTGYFLKAAAGGLEWAAAPSGGAPNAVSAVTADIDVDSAGSAGVFISADPTSGAIVVTIRPNASYSYSAFFDFWILAENATNNVTLTRGSGVSLIDGTSDANITLTTGVVYHVWRVSSNVWRVISKS